MGGLPAGSHCGRGDHAFCPITVIAHTDPCDHAEAAQTKEHDTRGAAVILDVTA